MVQVYLTLAQVRPGSSSGNRSGKSPAVERLGDGSTKHSRKEQGEDDACRSPHLDDRRWRRYGVLGRRGYGDMHTGESEHSSDLPDLPAF